MFNPLHPFEPRFIKAFQQKGVKAFVKQTYQRGRPPFEENKEGFVMIHFERALAAQQYYDVLNDDPNRELLWLGEPGDLNRLHQLLAQGNVFMMLKVKDAERRARKLLDKKIRAFIEYRLHWYPGLDQVKFSLDVQFGEVYARLRFRAREIMVKLAEIENAEYVL
ncbi:MAG TPA: hypothetical protein VFX58_04620 [Chitinophagaceae bacterium]|nr:hypothetical protein [Chitinophagaceae bacterium]